MWHENDSHIDPESAAIEYIATLLYNLAYQLSGFNRWLLHRQSMVTLGFNINTIENTSQYSNAISQ